MTRFATIALVTLGMGFLDPASAMLENDGHGGTKCLMMCITKEDNADMLVRFSLMIAAKRFTCDGGVAIGTYGKTHLGPAAVLECADGFRYLIQFFNGRGDEAAEIRPTKKRWVYDNDNW